MLQTFTKILLALGIIYLIFFKIQVSHAVEAPALPIEEWTYEQQITHYAELYGFDPVIGLKVAKCESGLSNSAIGDNNRAKGIFQYHKASFDRHAKLKGEELDYTSAHDQIKLAMWAMANGHANEWTAYRAIKNGGTYSFYSKLLGKHYIAVCK